MEIQYPEPDIKMTYLGTAGGDGGDQYRGLDRFGRIIDIRWMKNGADLERIQYGFDRASNRLWRWNPRGTSAGYDEAFGYDGRYQLTDRRRGTLDSGGTIIGTPKEEEIFAYDSSGNWNSYLRKINGTTALDQSRHFNRDNEITDIGGSTSLVAYDAVGNMKVMPKVGSWTTGNGLVWDAWNRLVTAPAGKIYYDGGGRRIITVSSTETRHFYYSDTWQILEERVGSPTIADRQYTWGMRYADDLIMRYRPGQPGSSGGSSSSSSYGNDRPKRAYALHDQWSITAVASNEGKVVERYAYRGFGSCTFLTPEYVVRSSSILDWETLYAAYYLDSLTGLYLARYRYYHPDLGRWVSRDPIAENGGTNLYAYVRNVPTGFTDPTGLGEWHLDVSERGPGLAANVDAYYVMDEEEEKCCTAVTVTREIETYEPPGPNSVDKKRFWTPDDWGQPTTPTNSNGVVQWHGSGDYPEGPGIAGFDGKSANLPNNQHFRWTATCTAGKANGKVLSKEEKWYHSSGHTFSSSGTGSFTDNP